MVAPAPAGRNPGRPGRADHLPQRRRRGGRGRPGSARGPGRPHPAWRRICRLIAFSYRDGPPQPPRRSRPRRAACTRERPEGLRPARPRGRPALLRRAPGLRTADGRTSGGARRPAGQPRGGRPAHLVRLVRRLARSDPAGGAAGRHGTGGGGGRQPGAAGQAPGRRRQSGGRDLQAGPGSSPRSRRGSGRCRPASPPGPWQRRPRRASSERPRHPRTPPSCSSPAALPASRGQRRSPMAAPCTTPAPSTSTSPHRTAKPAAASSIVGFPGCPSTTTWG